jgi:hypothetical protein
MNAPVSNGIARKKTKKCALAATITYLILFPFLLMLAVASFMVFDSPNITVPFGLSIILMYFLMPLSIPFTFYLVWSRYSRGDYKKSRRFCLLPIYVAGIVLGSFALMDTIS